MTDAMKYLAGQFKLQTRLFNNVTAEVSEADSKQSLNSNTNNMAWLAGHSVSTRYMLAQILGLSVSEPFPALFANGKGLDKTAAYPSMSELTNDWNTISAQIETALNTLPAEALHNKMPQPVPTGDTLGDFLAFLMHHEAYTIGQLGLARRFYGLQAMTYN